MKKNCLNTTFFTCLRQTGYALCISFLFAACASKPVQKPLWADYDTIEAVYPKADYIARIGTGDSAQTAGLLAEGALGTYFTHTVQSSTTARQTMTSAANTSTSSSRTIERTVTLESLMELAAVHKTNPYFDRESSHYVCCAFINREEAWHLYEGRLLSEREHFQAFFKSAEDEQDYLKRMMLLKKADNASQNYLSALDFARLLSPAREAAYAKDRLAIARLESEWEKAKKEAAMYVTVKKDMSGRISRCMTALLAGEGFMLAASPSQAVYTVLVEVEPNKMRHADMLTAEPGISVAIRNGDRQFFSYAKSLERISGFSEAEAFVDKKIYTALEEELLSSFLTEFRTALK